MTAILCCVTISLIGSNVAYGGADFVLPNIKLRPASLEQPGSMAGGVVALEKGLLLTLDVDSQQIVLFNFGTGKSSQRPVPPNISHVIGVRGSRNSLELIGTTGSVLARSKMVDAENFPVWTSADARTTNRQSRDFKVSRQGDSLLVHFFEQPAREIGKVVIPVHPRSGSVAVISNALLMPDRTALVAWEEIGNSQAEVVSAWVGRLDNKGLISISQVPIESGDQLSGQYVSFDAGGNIYYQDIRDEKVYVSRLSLGTPKPGPPIASRARRSSLPRDQGFDAVVQKIALDEHGSSQRSTALQPRTATQILAEADRYLRLSWSLTKRNLVRPGISSVCNVPQSKYWKLPHTLVGKENATIVAMPYRWGGTSTPESFLQRLKKGYLAGDVCTCRDSKRNYCIVEPSTGVDCSGFISNVWGTTRYTTSSLGTVAVKLKSITELKPGDILNKPESHVRLFVGFEDGPELRLKTIESAINCGGVCAKTYSPLALSGYVPLRYRLLRP